MDPACSEEAERIAERDPARAARLLFHVCDFFAEQDQVARGREVLARILALSAGAPDDQQVLLVRAWQAMLVDEIAEARATATRGLELSATGLRRTPPSS